MTDPVRRAVGGLILLALLTLGALFHAPELNAQDELGATARALAAAWSRSDGDAMAQLLDEDGVHLALPDKDHGTLDRRNAVAAVERFLDRYPVQRAELARASEVGEGSTGRAFAEIRWEAVAPGTSETVRYTLFAGLARTGRAWRVVELRVLP